MGKIFYGEERLDSVRNAGDMAPNMILLVEMFNKNPRERVRIETVVDYLKSNVI
jgi:hypothetical protein